MPNERERISSGLWMVKHACSEADLYFIRPDADILGPGTVWVTIEKYVSKLKYTAQLTLALSTQFLSDLPGTQEYGEKLTTYLAALSSRIENPKQNMSLTRAGIPLEIMIDWPFGRSSEGRDGYEVRVSIVMAGGMRGQANLNVFLSGTLSVSFPSLVPILTEATVVNAIRNSIDDGSVKFRLSEDLSASLQSVEVLSKHYDDKNQRLYSQPADEPHIKDFLLKKVYWLGFRQGDQDTEIWIADPYDADYLGAPTTRLKQLAVVLEAKGYLHLDKQRAFARASSELLKQSDDLDVLPNLGLTQPMEVAMHQQPKTMDPKRKQNDTGPAKLQASEKDLSKNKVFVVHGRNHRVRDQIRLFLIDDLGLSVTVMEAGAHLGRTLPEKFEEIARDCAFAVFILSADDKLVDRETNKPIKRPRQNVVLEVGYFWGMLGRRGKVAFLVQADPEMELPTDIQGVGWIPITEDLAETKLRLQRELKGAGLV